MGDEQLCQWEDCGQPGPLAVLVGEDPGEAERHGDFCVPHAAMRAGDLRDEQGKVVWIDLAGRPSPVNPLPVLRMEELRSGRPSRPLG